MLREAAFQSSFVRRVACGWATALTTRGKVFLFLPDTSAGDVQYSCGLSGGDNVAQVLARFLLDAEGLHVEVEVLLGDISPLVHG